MRPAPLQAIGLIPQLRTTDLGATIDFWTRMLGFELDFRFEDFYAGLKRGPLRLHLKRIDAPDPSIAQVRAGGHLHLYLEVVDVRAFAAMLRERGVVPVRDVETTRWGTVELVVEDDQGHTIVVGSPAPST